MKGAATSDSGVARVIVHKFDPHRLPPGGVETCISDLIAYAPPETLFAVVGSTADKKVELGRWSETEHRGRNLLHMPVAQIRAENRRRIPHSLLIASGFARWRRRMPVAPLQTHRIDVGMVARPAGSRDRGYIQFIHNPHGRNEGVVGRESDSLWRFAPLGYHMIEPGVLRRADRIVVFSRAEAERLQAQGHNAIAWQSWFDPAIFHARLDTSSASDRLDLAWIGRFERQKDPLLAMGVAERLSQRGVPFKLALVGNGTLRSNMENRAHSANISRAVTFRGALAREEVADVMRQSDVLLLTSHYEGSPRVLIEALASGTPVAATRAADPDGLLSSTQAGAVAATRDADSLADAVIAAALSPRAVCAAAVAHLSAAESVPRLLRETSLQDGVHTA